MSSVKKKYKKRQAFFIKTRVHAERAEERANATPRTRTLSNVSVSSAESVPACAGGEWGRGRGRGRGERDSRSCRFFGADVSLSPHANRAGQARACGPTDLGQNHQGQQGRHQGGGGDSHGLLRGWDARFFGGGGEFYVGVVQGGRADPPSPLPFFTSPRAPLLSYAPPALGCWISTRRSLSRRGERRRRESEHILTPGEAERAERTAWREEDSGAGKMRRADI